MLDLYIEGEVNRISPEAPVPVVKETNTYYTLGGVGNVANNLRSLGVDVDCISTVGNDNEGMAILFKLQESFINPDIVTMIDDRPTTLKTRIISDKHNSQMIRLDREVNSKIDHKKFILPNEKYDIIIISDYGKGVITSQLLNDLSSKYNCDIIVDPHPSNMHLYDTSILILTPNTDELKQIHEMKLKILAENILETKGSKGMTLFKQSGLRYDIPIENPSYVYSVIGAGDTVISVLGACVSVGFEVLKSARIANECAQYVIKKPGTALITKSEFYEVMENINAKR
jgi:rfaE bifunctional protein kinase chain/domain